MEAILKFNLLNEEDKSAFIVATKAMDWAMLVWDIDQYIRNKLKYYTTIKSGEEELELLRKELINMMENNALQFPS